MPNCEKLMWRDCNSGSSPVCPASAIFGLDEEILAYDVPILVELEGGYVPLPVNDVSRAICSPEIGTAGGESDFVGPEVHRVLAVADERVAYSFESWNSSRRVDRVLCNLARALMYCVQEPTARVGDNVAWVRGLRDRGEARYQLDGPVGAADRMGPERVSRRVGGVEESGVWTECNPMNPRLALVREVLDDSAVELSDRRVHRHDGPTSRLAPEEGAVDGVRWAWVRRDVDG